MHGPINVKYPNNISEWQMGFNSAFKGLTCVPCPLLIQKRLSYCIQRSAVRILTPSEVFQSRVMGGSKFLMTKIIKWKGTVNNKTEMYKV
jgi:hypothetical protein